MLNSAHMSWTGIISMYDFSLLENGEIRDALGGLWENQAHLGCTGEQHPPPDVRVHGACHVVPEREDSWFRGSVDLCLDHALVFFLALM
jgi:hypothetical protein